jgi:integration host factor subunit beta
MTRSELVAKLIEANPHLSQREVEIVVTTIFGEIVAALCRGDRVELRGFGSFRAKRRGARDARNPRTGDAISVPEKLLPAFRPSRLLGARLGTPV